MAVGCKYHDFLLYDNENFAPAPPLPEALRAETEQAGILQGLGHRRLLIVGPPAQRPTADLATG
jgi:hypothetical protein